MNNLFLKKQYKSGSRGFTLIELMVATSIFISVMLMAMGSLIVANATAKRAQQLRLAMDNVNFAMESMTRSLRMGTNYVCADSLVLSDLGTILTPTSCPGGGSKVAFVPAENMKSTSTTMLAFSLVGVTGHQSLERCDQNDCVKITSSDVDIDTLKFFVIGSNPLDHSVQPSVYIIMKGTVTVKGEATSFAIQTLASQRSFTE